MTARRRYWLFKSEPDEFSIHDLERAPRRRTVWDGVRNYQARNLLRDEIKPGDGVLFYHSQSKPPAVAGTAVVVAGGHPDPTQFEKGHAKADPRSDPEDPRWYAVDIELGRVFPEPVTLPALRELPALADMMLLQRGSRLSVQPVTAKEWKAVLKAAGVAAR